MSNYAKQVLKMSVPELLAEVLANPYYLTDSYYREFRDAIYQRANELDVWRHYEERDADG